MVWNLFASPRVLGDHLPKETLAANRNRLDAVKAKLAELRDTDLLLNDMCWFEVMLTASSMDQLFMARNHAPRMMLECRLKEQLQEGLNWCLPL